MRVLLTGATGFPGCHIARELVKRGVSVTATMDPSAETWRIDDILPELAVVPYDGGNTAGLLAGPEPVDYVVHTATSYGRHGEDWQEVAEANLVVPSRILEAAADAGVSGFVNTDTFFPRGVSGLAHFVESKKRFTDVCHEAAAMGRVRFINVVLHLAYGPADEPGKFLPWLIDRFLDNAPSVDLTSGEQQRDFIYVDDVASAYATLLENMDRLPGPEVDVELGTGTPVAVRQVVEMARELTGTRTEPVFGVIKLPEGEPAVLAADTDLLQGLGWGARMGLEEGLRRTVEWVRGRRNGSRP